MLCIRKCISADIRHFGLQKKDFSLLKNFFAFVSYMDFAFVSRQIKSLSRVASEAIARGFMGLLKAA